LFRFVGFLVNGRDAEPWCGQTSEQGQTIKLELLHLQKMLKSKLLLFSQWPKKEMFSMPALKDTISAIQFLGIKILHFWRIKNLLTKLLFKNYFNRAAIFP